MATVQESNKTPVSMDTPITVKVLIQGASRKFKIPLGDLNAAVLPGRLRQLLNIPDGQSIVFERFSDSAAAYVTLDSTNQHVYKALFRAAKAKGKLRLKVKLPGQTPATNTLPILAPMGLPGGVPSGFPDFARFGSETTLNNNQVESSAAPRAQQSAETLIPVAAGPSTVKEAPRKPALPPLNRTSFFAEIANLQHEADQRKLAFRTKEPQVPAPGFLPGFAPLYSNTVYCNACDLPMPNEHFHCDICDKGDYDLCNTCVNAGIHCPGGDNHWLIKRHIIGGKIVNSTTERVKAKAPVKPTEEAKRPEMPGAFTEHIEEKKQPEPEEKAHEYVACRTCNSCVQEDDEAGFVTCLDCDDYDLCFACHEDNKHGHHPGHEFKPVDARAELTPVAEFLCAAGRNTKHAALCDGCDKPIYGVRHKCLDCPDWDYCSECVKNAREIHPFHRFAALYDPLTALRRHKARHNGIYCDGPLCEDKSEYVEGVRYKCAICHDTDFCAKCEAHPHNKHNATHPLIQFKTPVRNASITTLHEDQAGNTLGMKGDHRAARPMSNRFSPANSATQVQTIVDVKPAAAAASRPSKEKIEIKDLLAEPIQEKIKVQDLLSSPMSETKKPFDVSMLSAEFIHETIPDGTEMASGRVFTQTWTLRNEGPNAWPAGCGLRYVGGDNMLVNHVADSNIISSPVLPGAQVSFTVTLKAKANEGAKISYWRVKTPDGQVFGARLWCHIVIKPAAEVPQPKTALPPADSPAWQDNFLYQALQNQMEAKRRSQEMRARQEAARQQEYQRSAEGKASRVEMLRKLSQEISAVQDKARAANAGATASSSRDVPAPISPSELPAPSAADNQKALQALRLQANSWALGNYKSHVDARKEAEAVAAPAPAPAPKPIEQTNRNHALQDYQMQMMLLEQQNKKRLLMARQEQEKLRAELTAPVEAPAEASTMPKAPAPVEVEAEVKPIAVETPVTVKEEEKPEQKSGMIFPTLDKESPASSMVGVAGPSKVEPKPASVTSEKSDLEIFEDAESVSFADSDGFLTDEEYDILDASDEEGTF